MPAYHQMGHDSENLLWAPELGQYRGAILSPVNYDQAKVGAQIEWGHQRTTSKPSSIHNCTSRTRNAAV